MLEEAKLIYEQIAPKRDLSKDEITLIYDFIVKTMTNINLLNLLLDKIIDLEVEDGELKFKSDGQNFNIH